MYARALKKLNLFVQIKLACKYLQTSFVIGSSDFGIRVASVSILKGVKKTWQTK